MCLLKNEPPVKEQSFAGDYYIILLLVFSLHN